MDEWHGGAHGVGEVADAFKKRSVWTEEVEEPFGAFHDGIKSESGPVIDALQRQSTES